MRTKPSLRREIARGAFELVGIAIVILMFIFWWVALP